MGSVDRVLMLSLIIDPAVQRDVATADVSGAYLHANMEDFTLPFEEDGQSVIKQIGLRSTHRRPLTQRRGRKHGDNLEY